jgi:phosphoglycolate phosphatase-like HAD superfamily hydrolase
MSSRGQTRPWIIEGVYLFDAQALVDELKRRGVKLGIATSIRQRLWAEAEIYPAQRCGLLELSDEQRAALKLFGAEASG